MAKFTLIIEYLTGYAVATDCSNREQAEWPPHPARVFMALAAAHFETDPTNQRQREALEWLATLDPPAMAIPEHTVRDVPTSYVPVNDQKSADALLKRSRQPRFFPRVHVGSEPVAHTWDVAGELPEHHLEALESICRNVTRIGHSSSLVWVRIEREPPAEPTHVPDEHALEMGLRIVQTGALDRLEAGFNKSAIDEFFERSEQINRAKGKEKKQLQLERSQRFPLGEPTSQRPVFSISRGYRPIAPLPSEAPQSSFDPSFIVLRVSDGRFPVLGLESTAQVTHALRNLIMSQSRVQPVPPWIGGHEPSGGKLESEPHMAIIPLAYVGRPWIRCEHSADGHLMGTAIVLPRTVTYRDRASALSSILFDTRTNNPNLLKLNLGRLGELGIERETDFLPKLTLQTLTYTNPSPQWASVTPILLDRMPKADRSKDPAAWRHEVASIIAQSCRNIGLPEPYAVRVEKTPFFHGSLRAMPGQGGFPQLRRDKFQVHVAIEFDRPVCGPILLGAGRFRGYGLMRPWRSGEDR